MASRVVTWWILALCALVIDSVNLGIIQDFGVNQGNTCMLVLRLLISIIVITDDHSPAIHHLLNVQA